MMTAKVTGSCLCQKVRFEVEGSFDAFFLCHCTYCQKDTGSAHAANLFAKGAKLSWLSGESYTKTFTVPGTRHSKCFCTECGAALPRSEIGEGMIVLPAGSIDEGALKQPDAHIMMDSKASWDDSLDEVVKLDGLPG